MFRTKFLMTATAAALSLLPAARVGADAGDVAAGVLLGVIGSAAVNSANKKTTTKTVYVSPKSSAQRAETREMQTSLNYFGFPAGTPDGVMGRNTRNAVSQYQIFMGYPPTGELTSYEQSFLTSSYHRAISGGAMTAQMVATSPMGTRGLLKVYQQEAAGLVPVQPGIGGTMALAPVAPAPQETQPAPVAAEAEAGPALPSFMAAEAPASLASHCNKVSLLTNTNGGFVTQASMTNANLALNEQFCLARTYAIANGEELIEKVQGFTPEQIAAQCESLAPALRTQVAALSVKPRADVVAETGSFILGSGMNPAQLTGTARICLSVGYRTDDVEMALASALILTALGETAYDELMGHHLSQGFGASRRPDLALAWYESGLGAVENGGKAVFAPGQPERAGLIREAAYQIGGGAAPAPAAEAPKAASLPTFTVDN